MPAVYCEDGPWQRRQLQCTTCTGGSAGWLLLLCGSLTLHGALRPYFRTKAAEWALPASQPMLACLRGSRLQPFTEL